jgi:hypothetical protein
MHDVKAIPVPVVRMLKCVDIIKFLDHCVYWNVITAEEKPLVVKNLHDKVRTNNDSYVGACWIEDAAHYSWKQHEDVMTKVGNEFRKLYPQKIDLLWFSW